MVFKMQFIRVNSTNKSDAFLVISFSGRDCNKFCEGLYLKLIKSILRSFDKWNTVHRDMFNENWCHVGTVKTPLKMQWQREMQILHLLCNQIIGSEYFTRIFRCIDNTERLHSGGMLVLTFTFAMLCVITILTLLTVVRLFTPFAIFNIANRC